MADFEGPSLIEAANIMCGIAEGQTWSRNTKGRMYVERTFLGVRIVVTHFKHHVTVESPFRWRITVEFQTYRTQEELDTSFRTKTVTVAYPYPGERYLTENISHRFPVGYKPRLDVMVQRSFQRDWVILRMYASQFARHNEQV